jgi:hypothetical protein
MKIGFHIIEGGKCKILSSQKEKKIKFSNSSKNILSTVTMKSAK